MENQQTPPMTADKAHWTAVATALTSVILYLSGVMQADEAGFASSLGEALTLIAAVAVQAAVAWTTTYYKRNHVK